MASGKDSQSRTVYEVQDTSNNWHEVTQVQWVAHRLDGSKVRAVERVDESGNGENPAASLAGRLVGSHLVNESQCLQAIDDSNDFTKPLRFNSAVNFAAAVADAKDLETRTGWPPRVGFFFDQGQDFVIYGESVFSVNDLCIHGYLREGELGVLGYVVKYLRKIGV